MKTLSNIEKSIRIYERSFISIEINCVHGNNYFTSITYGRAEGALIVYEKIKKNIYDTRSAREASTMYNHFKLVENYGMFERPFISIENIGLHGNNYFVLITYGRAEGALTVYEKTKNIGIMKTLSKVEKNMVCLNIISFL